LEFWETVEMQRIMILDQAQWDVRFTSSLGQMLTIAESMGLPGQADTLQWVSGDATLDRCGAIDWTSKSYTLEKASDLFLPLREIAQYAGQELEELREIIAGEEEAGEGAAGLEGGGASRPPSRAGASGFPSQPQAHGTPTARASDPLDDLSFLEEPDEELAEDLIISIAEFLTLVFTAAALMLQWGGKLIIYAGDNMNVQRWVETRRSRNAVVRYLLRVLMALEATGSSRVVSTSLRTYHNVSSDALTRDARRDIEAIAKQHGLKRVSIRDRWAGFLERGWVRRAFLWAGQPDKERQVAKQLAIGRKGTPLGTRLEPAPGIPGTVIEVQTHAGGYALGGVHLGMQARILVFPGDTPGTLDVMRPQGVIALATPEEARAFCHSVQDIGLLFWPSRIHDPAPGRSSVGWPRS
jgi:hypothetical protein